MKNLILLNDDTNIKLGDTGTLMQFKADDNNAPVSLVKGQSATFRIKNEFGFLKSIDADTTMSGYVFQFDTSALDGLVPGTYQLELAVAKSDDDVDIFPDTGFVEFTINENALSITGEQLPVMSLDDFKKQAQTYVDTQVNGAETSLKNDFQKYVDGIQSNAINVAKQASTNATQAVNTAQAASTMVQAVSTSLGAWNDSKSLGDMRDTNGNLLDFNKIPKGLYQFNGWSKTLEQKMNNFPTFAINHWGQVLVLGSMGRYYQIVITDDNTIHSRILNTDYSVAVDWKLMGGVTNRLVNSDFIQGVSGYNSRNATLSIESGCSGFNALKIISTVSDTSQYNGAYGQQKIPVEPGDKVFASLNYKGSGMNQNGKMEVNIYDSTGNRLSNGGILLTNQDDWNYAEYSIVAPDKASYIRVNFFVYNQGTVWIDSPQVSINVNGNYTPSVTALGDQVQSLQSQIGEIMTQVAKIQSGGVAKPLGGRNLLLDSQKGQSEPWLYKNKDNADMTFIGCNVGKVNQAWTRTIGGYNPYDLYQRGLYNTTDTYTFSCYAKIDGDIQLRRGDIVLYGNATDSSGKPVDVSNVNSETWTQISISFKFTEEVPNKSDDTQTIRFEPNVSWDGSSQYAGVGTGYLYLACPQLERGTTASDYRPAPEDTASDMTNAQQQLAMLTAKIAQLETDKS